MAGFYDSQIQNRNFLSPTGFRFTLTRTPKVAFFANSANIPDLNLGVANQPSYLKDIDVPGDKLQFGDFSLRFLVDEDLKNYMEIQNWMRGLGYPESVREIIDFQNEETKTIIPDKTMDIYSDGSLIILTSNNNINFKVNFENMFPTFLSTLDFSATDTDVEYFTADVTFKYTIYNITDVNGATL
jgi:hypothetical protein|tara:strand:+ start:248 stop:802 length:555 start_codon:yes stop_codon:yes gene_type:complete